MLASITVLTVGDGNKRKFVDMIKELVERTNKEEEGCISFNLYEDVENPNVVSFVELWKDQESIDKHFNMEFFKRIVPEALKLCVGNPVYGGKFANLFEV